MNNQYTLLYFNLINQTVNYTSDTVSAGQRKNILDLRIPTCRNVILLGYYECEEILLTFSSGFL